MVHKRPAGGRRFIPFEDETAGANSHWFSFALFTPDCQIQ